jgi:ActR/RegA family two-component response regulator
MIGHVLASVARKALVSRMRETAVVHIIDDDESVRAALDGLLCSVGLAPAPHASVSEFLAAKRPDVPGCLVLDVRMRGISGLDFQEKLCGLGIHLPVILMTGHGDVSMSVRGIRPAPTARGARLRKGAMLTTAFELRRQAPTETIN